METGSQNASLNPRINPAFDTSPSTGTHRSTFSDPHLPRNSLDNTLPGKSQINLEFPTVPDLTGRGLTWRTLRPTSQYQVQQQALRAQNRDQPQPPPNNRLIKGMPRRQAIQMPPNDGGLPSGMPGRQSMPDGHIGFPMENRPGYPPSGPGNAPGAPRQQLNMQGAIPGQRSMSQFSFISDYSPCS